MMVPETSFVEMMSRLKNRNKSDTVIESKVGLANERHSRMYIGCEQTPVDGIVIGAIEDLGELVVLLFAQNTNILDIHMQQLGNKCLQHKHCDAQYELRAVEAPHGDSAQAWEDSTVLCGTPVFVEHIWVAAWGLGAAGAVAFGRELAAVMFPWDTTVQAPNPLVVLMDWVEGSLCDCQHAQVLRLPACTFGPSGQTNKFESNSELMKYGGTHENVTCSVDTQFWTFKVTDPSAVAVMVVEVSSLDKHAWNAPQCIVTGRDRAAGGTMHGAHCWSIRPMVAHNALDPDPRDQAAQDSWDIKPSITGKFGCILLYLGATGPYRSILNLLAPHTAGKCHDSNFGWAPGFKLHAKQIHCTAGVGADKGHKMYHFPDPVWNETMASE
ncbi:hypothetical protein DFH08DRAFT_801277 [Mycena albidolilacea]|uniref:Uncharacterized protein n=1 Tax=Mycena albidolilacea TaxID=1033008 RepID=A0AAD7AJ98_9AGAR|nr:hypothetical protein DFH08DRAFT_801277 [Mycena albidolilacea]